MLLKVTGEDGGAVGGVVGGVVGGGGGGGLADAPSPGSPQDHPMTALKPHEGCYIRRGDRVICDACLDRVSR